MKRILLIFLTLTFAAQLEVEGDLKVTVYNYCNQECEGNDYRQ